MENQINQKLIIHLYFKLIKQIKTKKSIENRPAFIIGGGKPDIDPRENKIMKIKLKYPKFNKHRNFKFYPIDFIQRKKMLSDIKMEYKEIERFRDNYRLPMTKEIGNKEIEKLQLEYQFKGGNALPDCIKYPSFQCDLEEKLLEINQRKDVINKVKKSDKFTEDEYNIMFDEIMGEIDERQKFLVEMMNLGNKNLQLKRRIQTEIEDRINDLEKLDSILENIENK